MSEKGQAAQADALDVLIDQEQHLIAHYEARQASAEAMAAAAVTAVLALAALTATAAKTIEDVNATFAWLVVGALVLVCVAALMVRSVAGLRHTHLHAFNRLRGVQRCPGAAAGQRSGEARPHRRP